MLQIQPNIPGVYTQPGFPGPASAVSPAANHLLTASNSTGSLPTIAHQPSTSASQPSGASAHSTLGLVGMVAEAMGPDTSDGEAYLQTFKFLPEGSGYHTATDFARYVQTYKFDPPWTSTGELPGQIRPARMAEQGIVGQLPAVSPEIAEIINRAEKGDITAPELIRQTFGTHIDLANHYLDQFELPTDSGQPGVSVATYLAAHLALYGKEPAWAAQYKIDVSKSENARDRICIIYGCTLSDVEQFLQNFELPAEHPNWTSRDLLEHIAQHKTVPYWAFLFEKSAPANDFLSASLSKPMEALRAELMADERAERPERALEAFRAELIAAAGSDEAAERLEMDARQYATLAAAKSS